MRNSVPMLNFETRVVRANEDRVSAGMPLPPCNTSGFVVTASIAASGTIDTTAFFRLQMDVAHGDGNSVGTALAVKPGCFVRIRAVRGSAPSIADIPNLTFNRHAGAVGEFGDCRGAVDVLRDRQSRTIIHDRGETMVDTLSAFLGGSGVIDMADDRHGCVSGKVAKHGAKTGDGRVLSASRPGL